MFIDCQQPGHGGTRSKLFPRALRSAYSSRTGLSESDGRSGACPHRSGDIADALGIKVQQAGPLRNGLIKKGMIWSPAHGQTAFTVPMFDALMIRAIPEWKPERLAWITVSPPPAAPAHLLRFPGSPPPSAPTPTDGWCRAGLTPTGCTTALLGRARFSLPLPEDRVDSHIC